MTFSEVRVTEQEAAPISAAIGRECERIIGEDGGLPSRNPEALMESYILLIWAARALVETGRTVDALNDSALDRMAPTLRGLRLGDGTMARFHGGRRGAPEHLDQAFSDARPRAAARSGEGSSSPPAPSSAAGMPIASAVKPSRPTSLPARI